MNAPSIRLHNSLESNGPSAAGNQSTSSKLELPGLNTIRAIAALGVVLLHACVPYAQHPMPGLQWSVQDAPSAAVDCLFWGVEVFVMPIFLVMAGFFAWQTLSRKGDVVLLKSRAKRLLVPLLFGMIVVLPIDLYIWIVGWIADGLVSPVKLKSLKFDGAIGENIWGLSHLWFLLYLFLYVAIAAAAARVIKKSPQLSQKCDRIVSVYPWLIGIGLVVIGALTLAVRPEVVWGFQHAFAPVPSKWIYSGTFFVGGMLLSFTDPDMRALKQHTMRLVPLAIVFLIAAVVLGRWHLTSLENTIVDEGGSQQHFACGVLAIVTTASAWLATFALIACAVTHVRRNSVVIQYLAAASFWVYLVHHPLLGLVHIDLKFWLPGLAPMTKTALAFTLSVTTSLLLYEAFVRQSKLGSMLGFAWKFRKDLPPNRSAIRLPKSNRRSPPNSVRLGELPFQGKPSGRSTWPRRLGHTQLQRSLV